jgi:hypothetical protein
LIDFLTELVSSFRYNSCGGSSCAVAGKALQENLRAIIFRRSFEGGDETSGIYGLKLDRRESG